MNFGPVPSNTPPFSLGVTYACTYQGCDKSFKRKDHLRRHAVNHSHQTFNCGLCHRPFKRLDLMLRHERRLVCAGGSGASSGTGDGDGASDESASLTPSKRRKSDPPSTSTDRSNDSLFGHIPSSQTVIDNTTTNININIGNVVPPPPPFYQNTNDNQFIVGNFPGDFGVAPLQQASWENFITDNMVNPLHDSAVLTTPWDTFATSVPIDKAPYEPAPDILLAHLQRAYPEFDVSLTYLLDAHSLYWSHVAPSFPFIHRGTFDVNLAPVELAIMLAVAGSVRMSSSSSSIGRRDFSPLVRRIRGTLIQEIRLDMPVSVLQAFALCHIYDTWWGTSETQFVAQCMWPVVVAHSRKKGIGVAGRPDYHDEQQITWAVWAKDEERRRAAYCVTLLDTQLSAFWNQHCSRQLSVFAHNLVLPCAKDEWDAPTAEDWLKIRIASHPLTAHFHPHIQSQPSKRKESRSSYLPGLHPKFAVQKIAEGYSSAILAALAAQEDLPFAITYNNSFLVEMVLMGLVAVAWDCRTRGGMGIRFKDANSQWRPLVFNAIVNIRAAYEADVMAMSARIETRDMRDTIATCIISVLCDIPMLNVVAGTTTFCGAPIGPKQYSDAKRRLKMWASTEDAWTCVWQSTRYLRQALYTEWGIYSSWAIYLSTLVIWGYCWSSQDQNDPLLPLPPLTSLSENDSGVSNDVQSRIYMFLDKILSARGRTLHCEQMELRELLLCVSEKLVVRGESIPRDNGILLRRMVSVGSGRR